MKDQMLEIISIGISVIIGLLSVFGVFYPIWTEHKSKRLFREKMSKGNFDDFALSQALRFYIRPNCLDIDPTKSIRMGESNVSAHQEDLFEKVDKFITKKNMSHRHLIILSDTGMGKTSFLLNYYLNNLRRSRIKRHDIVLMSLGTKGVDEFILQIPDKNNKVIFLDAYDEDFQASQNQQQRMIELLDLCQEFKRVVITSRTHFFYKIVIFRAEQILLVPGLEI